MKKILVKKKIKKVADFCEKNNFKKEICAKKIAEFLDEKKINLKNLDKKNCEKFAKILGKIAENFAAENFKNEKNFEKNWCENSENFSEKILEKNCSENWRPQIFGIIQGGTFAELREKSLREITAMNFDGFAFGGLAVGEPAEKMYKILDDFAAKLPADQPRYLMGVGTPENILEAIGRGIDMFDCVLPARNGRHGTIFTSRGILKILNSRFRDDLRILDENCSCPICRQKFSRAFLRHLFSAGEILGPKMATIHNLFFYQNLLRTAREKILAGKFFEWKKKFLQKFNSGEI